MPSKIDLYIPDSQAEPKSEQADKTAGGKNDRNSGAASNPKPIRRKGSIRPIILSLLLIICFGKAHLQAQITGSVSAGIGYSDNVFQLSESDLERFDHSAPALAFVKTTDDLTLKTKCEFAYPLHYRWWKITPGVSGTFAQNISNSDKYRPDLAFRLRVDRYYWNLAAQYAHSPHIYYRDFTDSDGSGALENYSYSRNTYRLDAAWKPLRRTSLKAGLRWEDYYYNEYFTEADGSALTGGLSLSHRFPVFTLDAGYDYRKFDNDNRVDNDDASYESNIYKGRISLPRMPLNDKGKTTWQPSLALNYEQRYYQGGGSWYGGRADYTYTLAAGADVFLSPRWNFALDYTHIFRNVESNNETLIRLKEYSENRLGAELKYKF